MQDLTSKVSSCSPFQKQLSWKPTFFVTAGLIQRGKALGNWKEIGTVLTWSWKEERERETLANDPYPWGSHWTRVGRREEHGTRYVLLKAGEWTEAPTRGGKNRHVETSAQMAPRSGACFQIAIPGTMTHHQGWEATWVMHSVRAFPWPRLANHPKYLSSNTSDNIPKPNIFWDSDGLPPLYGPNCLKAIPSKSICRGFNAIKMVTRKNFQLFYVGGARQCDTCLH